jgi:hypothetical protein
MKEQNTLKPLRVTVDDDMRMKGITGEVLEIPIQFDPTTFFA